MTQATGMAQLDPNFAAPTAADGLAWFDVRAFGVEGRGWDDTESFYDRLPARAKGVVRPAVWDLAQNSAGMRVRFESDSPALSVKWKLRKEELSIPQMAATGMSGVDLYVHAAGEWRWAAAGVPRQLENSQLLLGGLATTMRHYALYLPLYNGVEWVQIGVKPEAVVRKAPVNALPVRPICFYGTSIVHGGCAARPGMAYPAILGRRLQCATLNLGFAGNGKAEPEVAKLLAELDPSVFVLDPLPNLSNEDVRRVEALTRTLRAARPETPIVIVGNVVYEHAWIAPAAQARLTTTQRHLDQVLGNLARDGVTGIHYVAGAGLLGDGDATVDGTHPTDAGFLRMADALYPLLRDLV